MGCNAIRTSHNPPAPELLDLCDRMGFVVMDEAFDEWKPEQDALRLRPSSSTSGASATWSRMVRRDRNHPSVIMWSIGNEIPEQRSAENGEAMATRLADICRARGSDAAGHLGHEQPERGAEDGIRQAAGRHRPQLQHSAPTRACAGSGRSSRRRPRRTSARADEYNLVLKDGARRDRQAARQPVHVLRPRRPAVGQHGRDGVPGAAGDRRGLRASSSGPASTTSASRRRSAGPTAARTSASSICAGSRRTASTSTRASGAPSRWCTCCRTGTGRASFEGKEIPVWCYTNAESVELFLNGRSVGVRDWSGTSELHLTWQVPYEPGTLRAVARRGGKVVARDEVRTAGRPARIVLDADRAALAADGQDLAFVTVRIVDAQGRLCRSDGDHAIGFRVSGARVNRRRRQRRPDEPRTVQGRDAGHRNAQGLQRPVPRHRQGRPDGWSSQAERAGRRPQARDGDDSNEVDGRPVEGPPLRPVVHSAGRF